MKLPSNIFLGLFISLAVLSCTNNDAQQEFERQALSLPEGITRTDNDTNIIGDADDDDWRSSPFYTGIAFIEPAFPNPILYGTTANLDVDMNGNSLTSILELGFFDLSIPSNPWIQLELKEDITEFSFPSFIINSNFFGSNAEQARGFYRLIVFDGNNRVVTYGDIQIE
ncbi:MAG: hypothetical protein RLN90_03815 [Balneolaceae bacterium]